MNSLEIDSKNLTALLRLAEFAIEEGDDYAALDRLLIAVKHHPTMSRVYKLMARIYDNIGDESAADYYRDLEKKYKKKK